MIDSHVHLLDESFEKDFEKVLFRAKENGLSDLISIITSEKELEKALLLPPQILPIYHVAAVTPHDAYEPHESFFLALEKAAKEKKLVAIGETGLEYYHFKEGRELQKELFMRHIELAQKLSLPLVIHVREAFLDLVECLEKKDFKGKVLLHCFTGTLEEAKKALSFGFKISISGIVTFKKSDALQEVAKNIPLESLLIETDAPWLSPEPARHQKRNEPANLLYTARFLSTLRGESFEEFTKATAANTRAFFGL